MRSFLPAVLITASLVFSGTLSAQLDFPEIPFDAEEPLTLPANIHLGEAAGVATNSNGDIFVYTRTGTPSITIGGSRNVSHGGSRLFKFDRDGDFVREIGQGVYGFLQAQQVRVDADDNIWVVDQMSTQVIKFDPDGRIQMVLSRKPEAMRVPENPLFPRPDTYALVPAAPPEGPPAGGRSPSDGSGEEGERFNRPTDVAWVRPIIRLRGWPDGFWEVRIPLWLPTMLFALMLCHPIRTWRRLRKSATDGRIRGLLVFVRRVATVTCGFGLVICLGFGVLSHWGIAWCPPSGQPFVGLERGAIFVSWSAVDHYYPLPDNGLILSWERLTRSPGPGMTVRFSHRYQTS